jgi:integrase
MKANFTSPKICPADFDMNKEWFVYFRYTHPSSGIRKLFKFKAGLNSVSNKKVRKQEAQALSYVLTEKLKSGWNPFFDDIRPSDSEKSLIVFLREIYNIKVPNLRKTSIHSYNGALNSFEAWLKDNSYSELYPQNFTSVLARKYMDYLLSERKFAGKTHNNHLRILRLFFTELIEREVIEKNPFRGFKNKKEDFGKNFPYNEDEKTIIKEYLYENNRRIYYACQFVYYCFIRRTELVNLKVENIDWENKTISFQSSFSKNHKQESVTIPKSFEKVLIEMGLDNAPKDHYIFGYKFETCERPIKKVDCFTKSHKSALKKLNIGNEKGFYSWKHTGVCDLYNITKDPYLVMQQCRHSDIKITMIYLRSMGLTVNEKIREAVFNF